MISNSQARLAGPLAKRMPIRFVILYETRLLSWAVGP